MTEAKSLNRMKTYDVPTDEFVNTLKLVAAAKGYDIP
jgi:hypothetical protein